MKKRRGQMISEQLVLFVGIGGETYVPCHGIIIFVREKNIIIYFLTCCGQAPCLDHASRRRRSLVGKCSRLQGRREHRTNLRYRFWKYLGNHHQKIGKLGLAP